MTTATRPPDTETGAETDTSPGRRRFGLTSVLGRQPLGILFAAPYALFLAVIFAYPIGLAVWISFHDYFFTAPGVAVDRPFVGLDNYIDVLSDPAVRKSFLNVLIFLVINVPLTVKEIQAAAFFKEIAPDSFRISLRSKGDVDVNRVAIVFGGGGHKNAAGCTINGAYSDVRKQLLAELKRSLV